MRRLAVAFAVLLLPNVCHASDDPCACATAPYDYPRLVRTLLGTGGSGTQLPAGDRLGDVVMTTELGGHPFSGALGTGASLSSTLDIGGLWSVVTPGIFAKFDLTYVFLTGLWASAVPCDFPFRLQLGGRLGLSLSQSSRSRADLPSEQPYSLVRPELETFFDVERPLGTDRSWSLVARGAIDSAFNLSGIYRWSVSFGVSYGWGQ
jgi:hypothetical protein